MVTSVIKFWLKLAAQKSNNPKGVVYVAVEREHGPSVMSLRLAIAAKAKIIVDEEEETQAFPIPSVVAKFLPSQNESDKTRILPLRPLSHQQQAAVNAAFHNHRTNHRH